MELKFDIFSGIGAAHREVAAGLSVSMLRGEIDPSQRLPGVSFCDHRAPIRGSRDRRVRISGS
jgi:hypothetical protein